jgi:hypothetical protein
MREGFVPLYVYLEMVPVSGPNVAYVPPFTVARNVGITIGLALNFLFVEFKRYGFAKTEESGRRSNALSKSLVGDV